MSYPIEQDSASPDGDGLPTYEYLLTQEEEKPNPNARFGRWRGWVEKRAAERYLDQPREARPSRGWGIEEPPDIRTLNIAPVAALPPEPELPSAPPHTSLPLAPAHLSMHNFGSRFLPHAISPIRALLPILGNQFLLIGDEDGLGMLNMQPEIDNSSLDTTHPLDAVKRQSIWNGESIWQLAILEGAAAYDTHSPQGVVLALVGTDADGVGENMKTVRMYNLASLVSLVRWTASQKEPKPLELHGSYQLQMPKRRTLTKNSKPQSAHAQLPPAVPPKDTPPVSRQPPATVRSNSAETEGGWDIVDDLPLRWATDYVSLAPPGSKLANSTVLFFELWRNDQSGRGTAMLAVATKTNILLYETPKGERAFRFVKEFYTPLAARRITFVQQGPHDQGVTRSSSALASTDSPPRSEYRPRSVLVSHREPPRIRRISTPGDTSYGSQLSLFVIFEKKAGLIRISDSAVGEIELWDDGLGPLAPSPTSFRRSFQFDAFGLGKDWKGSWVPPFHVQLPVVPVSSAADIPISRPCIFMTRGKSTHILPSPLPIPLSSFTPLRILTWKMQPSQVIARLALPYERPPYLQVLALGEDGVEVQEISLSFLGKGKGKARAEEAVRAFGEVAEPSGFLCMGGYWHMADHLGRTRLDRNTVGGADMANLRKREEGFYAWSKKGLADWRVFWIGPIAQDSPNAQEQ